MVTKSLDDLKTRTYRDFDAAAVHEEFRDEMTGNAHVVMGAIAQAIVAHEREQRKAKESKTLVLEKQFLGKKQIFLKSFLKVLWQDI